MNIFATYKAHKERKKFFLTYSADLMHRRYEVATGDTIKGSEKSLRFLFFENGLGKRKYEIKGENQSVEYFNTGSSQEYGDCEEWLAGGQEPEWAECIVAKKLAS